VLEETAEELKRFELDLLPFSCATLAKRPSQSSVGQELNLAVPGSRFEHVTAQIAEGLLATAHGGAVNHPALYPHFGGKIGECLGHSFLECLSEEGAATIAQSFDGQKELGATGDPLPLVLAQAVAWYQIMVVRMIFESSAPGVQHTEQTQGGTETFGILRQILQGLGTSRQKQVITESRMRTDPAT
jgi:hypothetical protein